MLVCTAQNYANRNADGMQAMLPRRMKTQGTYLADCHQTQLKSFFKMADKPRFASLHLYLHLRQARSIIMCYADANGSASARKHVNKGNGNTNEPYRWIGIFLIRMVVTPFVDSSFRYTVYNSNYTPCNARYLYMPYYLMSVSGQVKRPCATPPNPTLSLTNTKD